jgi:E3 ubiquitin-protein ligase HERC2
LCHSDLFNFNSPITGGPTVAGRFFSSTPTAPGSVRFGSAPGSVPASLGLAHVGTKAALSFAFAFLRRAWRNGDDLDLCTELLQESLAALQSLPEATLFDEDSSISPIWLEALERASKFLKSVVCGDINGGSLTLAASMANTIPTIDRQVALALLFELALQRGLLRQIVELVLLMLRLWDDSMKGDHHETGSGRGLSAPLVPLLRRFEYLQPMKSSARQSSANLPNGSPYR